MRNYQYILSIIKASIFIAVLIVFSGIFDFNSVLYNDDGNLVLFDVFDSLKNMLSYCLYFLLYGIAIAIGFSIASMFIFIPDFNTSFMFAFIIFFFTHLQFPPG